VIRRYEKYKDSGVEWIGEIPEEWEVKRVKYLAENLDGKRVPLNSSERSSIQGDYPYYGANGIVDYVNDYIFDGSYVLVGEDGAPFFIFGRDVAFHVEGKFWVNNHAHILRPLKDNPVIITHLFNSVDYKNYISGSTRDKLTQDQLSSIQLLEIPLNEQTAIASFLDRKTAEIDQLIANKEKLIALYEEEKTAIINRAVTKGLNSDVTTKSSGVDWLGDIPEHWEVKRLKYLTLILNDGTHGTFKRTTLGYRLLSVRNIKNDEFVFLDDDSRISEEDFDIITKPFLVAEGDLQLAIVGATLGKVAIVPKSDEKFATQRSVATIRAKQELIHNKFLFYFLKSSSFQSFLWLNAGFSAQPGIYLGSLANCHIPTPDLTEQADIVSRIETECSRLDTIIDKFKKQIEHFKEYRTTLISEVVTGKIDVRDEVAA
jgi:type I restriction enzyme S subunit